MDTKMLKQWADDFEAAAVELQSAGGARIKSVILMTRAHEVREEIATAERMVRVDGSIAKRLSENISHNIELRAGLQAIMKSLKEGAASEGDTVWFDRETMLFDYCNQLLNRRAQR